MLKRIRGNRWLVLVSVLVVLAGLATACSQEEAVPEEEESQEEAEPQLEKLSFVIDTEAFRNLEAEALAAQLRSFGMDVDVREWEWATLKEKIKAGERSAYLTDWGSAFYDPFDLAVPKLRTDDRGNYSFYSNTAFDEAMTRAISTADEAQRRQSYHEAQEILKEDAPWVFGYYLKAVAAKSKLVENWEPRPDSRINLHDVELTEGDTVVVGLNADTLFALDPAASYRDRETETVIRNMFDGLVNRTVDGKVVPELAESWDITDDGKTYTFTLREGVTFHNGAELTADDVMFTFEKIYGLGDFTEPTSRSGLVLPKGASVELTKVDESTVQFSFSQPFPVFLQGLVHQQVVPKDYYLEVGEEGFAEKPVGTGPFMFVSGQLNDQITVEAYPDYYGGSPDLAPVGPPKIARAIFRMMPEPSTRVSSLKAGEVHIIQSVPVDLIPDLESVDNVDVLFAEGTRNYAMEFNNAQPPFDDVRVRQALNYAINWEPILSQIYGGYATRLPTAFLPSGFGYKSDLEPYGYDPDKAVELLTEAGYDVHKPE